MRKPEEGTSGFQEELRRYLEANKQIDLFYYVFQLFARAGTYLVLLLVEIRCKWCDTCFFICQRCFRGQTYCCDKCRIAGKRHKHREAQRRYRRSRKGKDAHRKAEQRRRRGFKKTMADRGSTMPAGGYKIQTSSEQSAVGIHVFHGKGKLHRRGSCHFCGVLGVIVEKFPRRGYGAIGHQ